MTTGGWMLKVEDFWRGRPFPAKPPPQPPPVPCLHSSCSVVRSLIVALFHTAFVDSCTVLLQISPPVSYGGIFHWSWCGLIFGNAVSEDACASNASLKPCLAIDPVCRCRPHAREAARQVFSLQGPLSFVPYLSTTHGLVPYPRL